jgi:uncharacterized membrane protein YraQ (UPF0718 family)
MKLLFAFLLGLILCLFVSEVNAENLTLPTTTPAPLPAQTCCTDYTVLELKPENQKSKGQILGEKVAGFLWEIVFSLLIVLIFALFLRWLIRRYNITW